MRASAYHRPRSLAEAFRLKAAEPAALWIAGGTDVMVQLRGGRVRPRELISLGAIPELAGVRDGDCLTIGAMTRVADVAESAAVARQCPALAQAARALGSVQIRNAATVGGNLCNASPCADLAPPLIVHEARARVEGPAGVRELAVGELFAGPGSTRLLRDEILTAILVPRAAASARSMFLKRGRVAMDLSIASVAALVELDGSCCVRARVAAGAVAPRPLRLRGVEASLEGRPLDESALAVARAQAAREVAPISDLRAGAEYRRHLAGVLVERALSQLAGRAA